MDSKLEMCFRKLARNEIADAKKYLRAYMEGNEKKCDREIKHYVISMLDSQKNFMNLPCKVRDMMIMEDVSNSNMFDFERYLRSEKDDEIIEHMLKTHQVRDKLSELGIKYINSLLLYGPPGCGKTLMGRYIAHKLGLPFAYISFGSLIDSLLGQTGKNIETIFRTIREISCVLMLDEIDAIGLMRERSNGGAEAELGRVTIVLMQSLDNLFPGTVVIGATNRFDMLDNALLRRFSIKHEVKMPSVEAKEQLIEQYLSTIPDAVYTKDGIGKFLRNIKNYESEPPSNIISCLNEQIIQQLSNGEQINFNG